MLAWPISNCPDPLPLGVFMITPNCFHPSRGPSDLLEDQPLQRPPHLALRLGRVIVFVFVFVRPPPGLPLGVGPLDPGPAVGHLDRELIFQEARPVRVARPEGGGAVAAAAP